MKYHLCLDKTYKNEKKYYQEILDFLPKEDIYNLKAICEFTMQFTNSKELKKYLLQKGLIAKYTYDELLITYSYQTIRCLTVPYMLDKKFFNQRELVDFFSPLILKNTSYMNNFRIRKNMPEVFYQLYFDSGWCDIPSKLDEFFNQIFYNKGKFSYKTFYDIAMKAALINRSNLPLNADYSENITVNNNKDSKPIRVLKKKQTDEIEGQLRLF